jgi:uncharacterized RDD family membrane protein YckC
MYCPKCGAATPPGAAYCGTCGANVQTGAPPTPPSPVFGAPTYPPQPVWDYASWGSRVLGYIIDMLLVGVGMCVLYVIVGASLASIFHFADVPWNNLNLSNPNSSPFTQGFCCFWLVLFPIAALGVGLFNGVYLVSKRGASIGQGVMKIVVVDADRRFLTPGKAFLRLLVRVALGTIAFISLLDLIWPLFDERRQTLHDKAVGCYVINVR